MEDKAHAPKAPALNDHAGHGDAGHGGTSHGDAGQMDLNLKLLAVIGIVSILLLAEVVVVAEAYFYNTLEQEIAVKQVNQPAWELSEILLGEQVELNTYRWVDREKQRVSIPIDRAIKRFVEIQAERAATQPG